jgi:hypothetical protein
LTIFTTFSSSNRMVILIFFLTSSTVNSHYWLFTIHRLCYFILYFFLSLTISPLQPLSLSLTSHLQSFSFNPACPPLPRLGFDEEGRRRIGEKEIWERWVDRGEAPIVGEQRRRFPSRRGADCRSRVIIQRLKSDFRRKEIFCGFFLSWPIWCVLCSGVSNFGCVCVLAVLWTSGRVFVCVNLLLDLWIWVW